MSLLENRPYELSLWEDVVTTKDGGVVSITEQRLCIIGSNKIASPIAAFDILLNRKLNGEKTLTFSINALYWDQDEETWLTNPYLTKLTNERKVKLKWKGQWHDFIIKNVSEDSKKEVFTYTAKDQHVLELAKNGYNIQFDQELENSIQTPEEFITEILKGTDWKVGKCDSFLESTTEALYEFKVSADNGIIATSVLKEGEMVTIPKNFSVFVPYSIIQNKTARCQILYSTDNVNYENPPKDDEGVLLEKYFKNYYIDVQYAENGYPTIFNLVELRNDCRGKHYVRMAKSVYDANIDKYVGVYTKTDENGKSEEYYGFTETEYLTQEIAQNLISNSESFTNTSGWKQAAHDKEEKVAATPVKIVTNFTLEDVLEEAEKIDQLESFLELPAFSFNSGFYDSRAKISNLVKGQKYVFEIEYPANYSGNKITKIKVCDYDIANGRYVPKSNGVIYFEKQDNNGFSESTDLECLQDLSEALLLESRIGIFFEANGSAQIKSIALYRRIEIDGQVVKPNEIIYENKELVSTEYYYYKKPEGAYDLKSLTFSYQGTEPSDDYVLQYDEKYQKKRSLTASKSNRFNLLQKVCETFEGWLDIQVEHDEVTGAILFEDGSGKPKKSIALRQQVGKENFSGFKYETNLDSIQRKVDSEAIVTKMIVEANANEFAQNGFCTIARSPLNPSGTNVVYNFDYYIGQNLLTQETVQSILNNYNGSIKQLSMDIDELQRQKEGKESQLIEIEASHYFESTQAEAAQTQLAEARQDLIDTFGHDYEWFERKGQSASETADNNKKALEEYSKLMENNQCVAYLKEIIHYKQIIDLYENTASDPSGLAAIVQRLKEEIQELDDEITTNINTRVEVENEFQNKLGRFIQEGNWISEEYTDDNLYYLDALSTLYTSSRPRVTYKIQVFDLSGIEGYENYEFDIGEKTFVQDPEFFGWVRNNGVRTPRKEEVVISEITEGIDNITKNTINVQNYKTQFEDLFQRIAAATESLQYNSGRYEKFSKAIDSEGAITHQALQESIDKNGVAIANAGRQTVSCDERGIVAIDNSNPSSQVKIIGGGMFLTDDGGITWSTGITGDGINADMITTGIVNTGKVNIMNGGARTHVWDDKGISSYKTQSDSDGKITSVDAGTFVRFDEFGVYGIKNNADFNARTDNDGNPIDKIERDASYALTWDGFILKSSDKGGRVEIDSEDDIVVYDEGGQQRVKIGRLDDNKYGTKIIGADGNQVIIGEAGEVEGKSIVIDSGANGKKFQVLEDGTLRATGAEISGNINMTGGTISWKAPNASTGVEIDGLNKEITELHTSAQLGISNAASALKVAQSAEQKADNADQKATNAEANAKNYANTEIGKLDKAVSDYLGIGGNTIVAEDYVVSPYIGGGYLNVTGNKTRVIIDPNNQSQKNQVLAAFNTDTNKIIFGIDRNGNAVFTGTVHATNGDFTGTVQATNGYIGGWTIDGGDLVSKTEDGGVYLSSNGILNEGLQTGKNFVILAGDKFGVTTDGAVFAKEFNISGGSIDWSNIKAPGVGQIDGLQSQLTGFKTDIGEINNTVASNKEDLEAQIKEANTAITQTANKIELQANQISNVEGGTEALRSEIQVQAGKIDLQAEKISSIQGDMTTQKAQLNIQAGQIALKASQTDFDTLTGRVEEAEGELSVQSEAIDAKVSRTNNENGTTGFGWNLNENSFTLTSYDSDLEDKNVFVCDKDGIKVTGTVYATDGEFSGTIEANTGHIGNLNIESGGLYYGNQSYQTPPKVGEGDYAIYVDTNESPLEQSGHINIWYFGNSGVKRYHYKITDFSKGIKLIFPTTDTKATNQALIVENFPAGNSSSKDAYDFPYLYRDVGKQITIPAAELQKAYDNRTDKTQDFLYLMLTENYSFASSAEANPFAVTGDGKLIATSGKIGGFDIDSYTISSTINDYTVKLLSYDDRDGKNNCIEVGPTDDPKFVVNRKGEITAVGGKIGPLTINKDSIGMDTINDGTFYTGTKITNNSMTTALGNISTLICDEEAGRLYNDLNITDKRKYQIYFSEQTDYPTERLVITIGSAGITKWRTEGSSGYEKLYSKTWSQLLNG